MLMQELVYNSQAIHVQDAEMLCLTDMWRAADCPENKRPAEWARHDGRQFIEFITESLNVGTAHIWKAGRGKDGRTFAHWQIGFAYAKYLSHEFHAWCNDVVRGHMVALSKRDETRQTGKVSRKTWTAACFAKGCDQRGIADGTNAVYQTFFNGKTAKDLREVHGLKKSDSPRDHMRQSTLAALSLTEALAAEHIVDMTQHGSLACVSATKSCAEKVKTAVVAARQERRMIEISE